MKEHETKPGQRMLKIGLKLLKALALIKYFDANSAPFQIVQKRNRLRFHAR